MHLTIIVAMTEEGVIGHRGRLPWHISDDLKRFKSITMGHPVIMGRRTYESIGRPLPGRRNIVLTRDASFYASGAEVWRNFDDLRASPKFKAGEEVFVIGGAEVYGLAYPQVEKMLVTVIHKVIPGDTDFPIEDWWADFTITERLERRDDKSVDFDYTYLTAVRKEG